MATELLKCIQSCDLLSDQAADCLADSCGFACNQVTPSGSFLAQALLGMSPFQDLCHSLPDPPSFLVPNFTGFNEFT